MHENPTIEQNYFIFNLASWVKKISKEIDLIRDLSKRHVSRLTLVQDSSYKYLVKSGAITGIEAVHNLTALAGRTVAIRKWVGDAAYTDPGEIDYLALGNGAGILTSASTALDNELYRQQADSRGYDENIAYLDWFIESASVADQTFTQLGSFMDGTAAVDSGEAFSLLSEQSIVKSGSIYISAKYTLN